MSNKIHKQTNRINKWITGIAAWALAFQCQSNSKSANQESSGRYVTEDSPAVKLEWHTNQSCHRAHYPEFTNQYRVVFHHWQARTWVERQPQTICSGFKWGFSWFVLHTKQSECRIRQKIYYHSKQNVYDCDIFISNNHTQGFGTMQFLLRPSCLIFPPAWQIQSS